MTELEPFLPPPAGGALAHDEDQAALRLAARSGAALCTLVGIDGTFSRRLGAQWALGADGEVAGSFSDHCLEQELAARVGEARITGQPMLLRYGRGSPFVDFRLPCGAGIDVLVDPQPDRAAAGAAVARLDARQEADLTLPVSAAADRPAGLLEVRRFTPSPRLAILGSGAEASALAHLADAFGLDFATLGPDRGLRLGQAPDGVPPDRWTAVVLLFHDHEWEGALLEWALASPAFYVGALGGKPTRESRIAGLRARGIPENDVQRVRSPIGLVRHARDPRTLALSVLAEIIAEYEALRP